MVNCQAIVVQNFSKVAEIPIYEILEIWGGQVVAKLTWSDGEVKVIKHLRW